MKNNIKKIIIATLVSLIAFTGVVTTVSASTTPTTQTTPTETTVTQGAVEIQNAALPTRLYRYQSRNFSKSLAKPPSRIYYRENYEGVNYGGYLTLTDYADADTRWLANYEGYIYR